MAPRIKSRCRSYMPL